MKTIIENFNKFLKEEPEFGIPGDPKGVVKSSSLGQTRRELEYLGIEAEEERVDTGRTAFGHRMFITKLTFMEPNGKQTTTLSFRGTRDKAPLIDVKSIDLE